jgi:PIN domain nuclease of toxin-antitoxin system
MNVLLDTHAFLWFISGDTRISQTAKEIIADLDNEVMLSVGTLWEIAIKSNTKKINLKRPFKELILEEIEKYSFGILPINIDALTLVSRLPLHHRDPFDRLLIAQAIAENVPIVTRDPAFAGYPVEIIW